MGKPPDAAGVDRAHLVVGARHALTRSSTRGGAPVNRRVVVRDIGSAWKALRRAPGFTVIAVLNLGLGIGASTSAFSVINEILLRPMPYPESGRLERIYRVTAQNSRGSVAPADYLD